MFILRILLLLCSMQVYANDFSSVNISSVQVKAIEFDSLNHATWLNNTVEWWYNPANQPFTTEQVIQAFEKATQAWQNISGVKFVYKGITTQKLAFKRDDKVVVGWLESDIFKSHYGDYAGYSSIWWTRNIVDGEVTFNAGDFFITRKIEDFQGLATHEIGHLLGLDHSDDPGSILYSPYHSYQYQLTLRTDDVNAARALYPCNGCGDWFRIFNWAESLYPELFNIDEKQAVRYPPFIARFYPKSTTYLGYNTDDKYFYGLNRLLWGEQLNRFGTLNDFLEAAIQAGF